MTEEPILDGEFVLVVDDEQGIRELLTELVQMAGCRAVVAANGAEALQVLSAHRPCLIIVDLLMPVMSGFDLLESLARDPGLTAIPVIILTSAPEQAPGGYPLLPKPIDIDALWDLMRGTCRCSP